MNKRILLVQPGERWDALAGLCRGMGLEPVIVSDARETASGRGILQPGQIATDTIAEAARAHHVQGIWTPEPGLWPAVTGAAALLGLPHAANAMRNDVFLLVQEALEARQVAFHPAFPAAGDLESVVQRTGLPLWVRASHGFQHTACIQVTHAQEVSLAVERARKRPAGGCVLLQRVAEGPVYRLLGFKVKQAFHPVEIYSESHMAGPARVPMCWALPAGLSEKDYAAVLEAGRSAGEALPAGHGPVDIELVLSAAGPVVTDLVAAPQVNPVLQQLFHVALGMELYADAMRVAVGEHPLAAATRGLAAAVCWLSSHSGFITDVRHLEEARALPGVVQVVVQARPGQRVGHILDEDARDRLGYVIGSGPTRDQALAAAGQACAEIEIETRSIVE